MMLFNRFSQDLGAAKKIAHPWRIVLAKLACCRCIILIAATAASVLEIYAAAVKFSLEEHQTAFDATVSTYRARNQEPVRSGQWQIQDHHLRSILLNRSHSPIGASAHSHDHKIGGLIDEFSQTRQHFILIVGHASGSSLDEHFRKL
jgi:hypothetical protein